MQELRAWPFTLRLLAAALLLGGAVPGPGGKPANDDPVVGQLLVAAPEMTDPRFAQTVILLVRHDGTGTLGVVINRPVEERSLTDLMAELGEPDKSVEGGVRLLAGGPVEPGIGFVVHSSEYRRAETIVIDDHIAVTSSPAILRDIGHGAGPTKSLVAFGYTGWGPGQLEAEMAHHDWFTEPEDPKLIFDEDRAKVWNEALARRPRDL